MKNKSLIIFLLLIAQRGYCSADLLVEGLISNQMCEIKMGESSPSIINLGRVNSSSFEKSGGSELYSGLYTSAESLKTFSVAISGCFSATDFSGGDIRLKVSSSGLFETTLGDKIFGGGPGQSTDAGVVLAAKKSPDIAGNKEIMGQGEDVVVYSSKNQSEDIPYDSISVEFDAMMASTRPKPAPGKVVVPITFTLINN
ncbi:hypothetical protein OLZ31_24265 [Enterobacter asburiae]|nr:hypothetical protein [Enterobacter asburiae]